MFFLVMFLFYFNYVPYAFFIILMLLVILIDRPILYNVLYLIVASAVLDQGAGAQGATAPPPEDAPKFNFFFNFSHKFCLFAARIA